MEEDELEGLFGPNERKDKIRLSFSRISDFDRNGPKALIDRTPVDNDGAKIGSLTDDLLNDIVNKTKLFKEKYYIFDGDKPTATLGKLADIILKNYTKIPNDKELLKIIKVNEFWKSQKDETKLSNVNVPEFKEYIKAQYMSKEKVLATTSEVDLAQDLVDNILIHNNSKYIFNSENELINQIKFEFEYKDFLLRGILDILSIDHKNKTIRMIDLKTGTNSLSEFTSSFIKWRYYIQEAIYIKASDIIKQQYKLEDYTVLPFQFLYISRYEKIPFIFEIGNKWHEAALKGFKTTSGWEYKGLEELLDNIKWHVDNKVYDTTKTIYEANGKMNLNDEFITIK